MKSQMIQECLAFLRQEYIKGFLEHLSDKEKLLKCFKSRYDYQLGESFTIDELLKQPFENKPEWKLQEVRVTHFLGSHEKPHSKDRRFSIQDRHVLDAINFEVETLLINIFFQWLEKKYSTQTIPKNDLAQWYSFFDQYNIFPEISYEEVLQPIISLFSSITIPHVVSNYLKDSVFSNIQPDGNPIGTISEFGQLQYNKTMFSPWLLELQLQKNKEAEDNSWFNFFLFSGEIVLSAACFIVGVSLISQALLTAPIAWLPLSIGCATLVGSLIFTAMAASIYDNKSAVEEDAYVDDYGSVPSV